MFIENIEDNKNNIHSSNDTIITKKKKKKNGIKNITIDLLEAMPSTTYCQFNFC